MLHSRLYAVEHADVVLMPSAGLEAAVMLHSRRTLWSMLMSC